MSQILKTSFSFTNQCILIVYGRLLLKQERFKIKSKNLSLRYWLQVILVMLLSKAKTKCIHGEWVIDSVSEVDKKITLKRLQLFTLECIEEIKFFKFVQVLSMLQHLSKQKTLKWSLMKMVKKLKLRSKEITQLMQSST